LWTLDSPLCVPPTSARLGTACSRRGTVPRPFQGVQKAIKAVLHESDILLIDRLLSVRSRIIALGLFSLLIVPQSPQLKVMTVICVLLCGLNQFLTLRGAATRAGQVTCCARARRRVSSVGTICSSPLQIAQGSRSQLHHRPRDSNRGS
jgi:hypothetical protein